MITLAATRDFIKKNCDVAHGYIGHIDTTVDNCIGVYNLKNNIAHRKPLGPASTKKYTIKGISVLVHGTKSKKDTEAFAQHIYDKLSNIHDTTIGSAHVIDLQLLYEEPVDVDFDDNGVAEYVIELILITEV